VSSTKRLLFETTITSPIETVWSALRDPEKIAQWFGWEYDGLADEISEYFIISPTEDPQQHSLHLSSGDDIELKAVGERTVFTAYRPAADVDPMVEMAADIDEGWIAFVEQLRFWLGRHPGEMRATVYVSGDAREHWSSLGAALGFAEDPQVGADYTMTLPDGAELRGEIWSRQENVVCLTAESYGDGLVVLIDQDSTRKSPNGAGMVIITTYGLTDAQLDALRNQWASLWAMKYDPGTEFGSEEPE
jgi:hypothetical protein